MSLNYWYETLKCKSVTRPTRHKLGQKRLCWLMQQRPISNAMRVGFTGERPWLYAPSNVICKTTFSYVFELTNRVSDGTLCWASLAGNGVLNSTLASSYP